jgi:hypothetical protein
MEERENIDNNELDPSKHSSILFLDNKRMDSFVRSSKGQSIVQGQTIKILNLSAKTDGNDVLALIAKNKWIEHGNLLLQSPYEKLEYIPIKSAPSYFAMQKILRFIDICIELGATKVTVQSIKIITEGKKYEERKKNNNKILDFFTWNTKNEVVQDIKKTISDDNRVEMVFAGKPPNLEKAVEMYEEFIQIGNDEKLRGNLSFLFRKLKEGNVIKNFNVTMKFIEDLTITNNLNLELILIVAPFCNHDSSNTLNDLRTTKQDLTAVFNVELGNLPIPSSVSPVPTS